ncbi:fasciclin domain-containing protein [Arthrospiribacter ruber]|uniref:Fasciclin domain-containing protein n=1 Tax=Arthrospiribacter ruber TaxID=2487934 RepID=A0A951IX88_9BACT|nr:fasciclin domain-containing protein [Arthrospiribacter ruber]MBW3467536.1 fasciclin domain-containing protein [Arthrospiribacter ruber]
MDFKLRFLPVCLSFILGSFLFFSCNIEGDLPPQNEVNLFATAEDIPELSIFSEAVGLALLSQPLSELGPFTVFAPSNEAFEALFREVGVSNVRQIPADVLQGVLLYHIVSGRILSKNISSGSFPTFLPETSLTIDVNGSTILINESTSIIRRDIEAENGMIHLVDEVLFPPSNTIMEALESNGNTIMVQALIAAGLAETLASEGPFTVFAPSNSAFERFLEDNLLTGTEFIESPLLDTFLSYHVVDGLLPSQNFTVGPRETRVDLPIYFSEAINGNLWLNGIAGINNTNINADNGIIHVLDYVLTPPTENMLDYLQNTSTASDAEFRILVQAVQLLGLEADLQGGVDENLTLFAPTDAAFENLFDELGINGLEDLDQNTLRDILLYHLVPERLFSQDLREDEPLQTALEGASLELNIADQLVNEANLLPDFLNTLLLNGVIHGIDAVLLPDE